VVKVKCPTCGFEFEYNPQSPFCPNCGSFVPPPQPVQQPTPQRVVSRYVIYAVRQDGSRERVTEVEEGGPEVVLIPIEIRLKLERC